MSNLSYSKEKLLSLQTIIQFEREVISKGEDSDLKHKAILRLKDLESRIKEILSQMDTFKKELKKAQPIIDSYLKVLELKGGL